MLMDQICEGRVVVYQRELRAVSKFLACALRTKGTQGVQGNKGHGGQPDKPKCSQKGREWVFGGSSSFTEM